MTETTVVSNEEAEAVKAAATRRLLIERRNASAAEYVAAQAAVRAFERTGEGGSMTFACKCGERIVFPFIGLE